MVKRVCLSVLCCLMAVPFMAAGMDSCFFQMPQALLPGISVNTRKDMVDFFTHNRPAVGRTAFAAETELTAFSADLLTLKTSASSQIQVKRLTIGTKEVFAWIHTVFGPYPNSVLSFYHTDWTPCTDVEMQKPTCLDFFDEQAAGEILAKRFEAECTRLFVEMWFESGQKVLHLRSNMLSDLTDEWLSPFLPFIKTEITKEF